MSEDGTPIPLLGTPTPLAGRKRARSFSSRSFRSPVKQTSELLTGRVF